MPVAQRPFLKSKNFLQRANYAHIHVSAYFGKWVLSFVSYEIRHIM